MSVAPKLSSLAGSEHLTKLACWEAWRHDSFSRISIWRGRTPKRSEQQNEATLAIQRWSGQVSVPLSPWGYWSHSRNLAVSLPKQIMERYLFEPSRPLLKQFNLQLPTQIHYVGLRHSLSRGFCHHCHVRRVLRRKKLELIFGLSGNDCIKSIQSVSEDTQASGWLIILTWFVEHYTKPSQLCYWCSPCFSLQLLDNPENCNKRTQRKGCPWPKNSTTDVQDPGDPPMMKKAIIQKIVLEKAPSWPMISSRMNQEAPRSHSFFGFRHASLHFMWHTIGFYTSSFPPRTLGQVKSVAAHSCLFKEKAGIINCPQSGGVRSSVLLHLCCPSCFCMGGGQAGEQERKKYGVHLLPCRLLIRCPPDCQLGVHLFRITKNCLRWGAKMVSNENAQNIFLGIFWFVWHCCFWKFPVWIFVENDAHSSKLLMAFGDLWVGISKKKRKIGFLVFRGVHLWVFGCLVRMGKTQIWAILLWGILKRGKFSKNCLCRCRNDYIFPYAGKNGQIYICTRFGLWAHICTKMRFCWGHVGLVVLFFFFGPPHLALNPPYFCCFVFVYLCLFCLVSFLFVFWAWELFSVSPFLSP